MTVPVVTCTRDGRIAHSNSAARALIGQERTTGSEAVAWMERLQPRMPSGIPMPREDLPPVRALGGEVVRPVDVLVRIGGRDALLAVGAAPAVDRRGRLRGAVVVLEDVTEQRRREAALRATIHRDSPAAGASEAGGLEAERRRA